DKLVTGVQTCALPILDVTVTTAGGTSAIGSGDRFTYAPRPTVTRITPASAVTEGGTKVTITGTGFIEVSAVTFGSVSASTFTVEIGRASCRERVSVSG